MSQPLGAVIAGGRSLRYGTPKAIAEVGAVRIIDRVLRALREATPDLVLIGADPLIIEAAGVPARADVLPGLGALAGIHAALLWARERARPGILAAACDMPFLSAPLLRHLAARAHGPAVPDVVIPESEGPRGVEPLCAYYGLACIEAIEEAAARNDRRLIGFHPAVRVDRVPLAEVSRFGVPAVLFLNVNTPEERAAADRLAAGV